MVEQLVRPTGLLEPTIEIKPTKGQIDDLLYQIKYRVDKNQRCLVTTLTKRMAEELADYLLEMGIKTHYLHSEIDTLERVEILRDLRLGVYDVVVGINLLREGLDLPEVSLVAILDADKEGYLRSRGALIQTMGRPHVIWKVMLSCMPIPSLFPCMKPSRRPNAAAVFRKISIRSTVSPPRASAKPVKDITERVAASVAEEKAGYDAAKPLQGPALPGKR